MLGPGALTTNLADLGADVIKVEPPQGDYGRQMTWPIVNGVSLLFLHISRGKRSVVLDLRTDAGRETFLELVRDADAVVEAMRPGRARAPRPRLRGAARGQPEDRVRDDLRLRHDRPVPRHAEPRHRVRRVGRDRGAQGRRQRRRVHARARVDRHQRRARCSARSGCSPACCAPARRARAASSRSRSPTRRPRSTGCAARPTRRTSARSRRSPATRPTTTSAARRAPRAWKPGVRYQFYATTDGYVLFMASEREFWKNFCEGVGRPDLFERWPGSQYGDHARGNTELRAILREIFAARSSAEWLEFGLKHNTPIAPSNTPKTIGDDPQFQDRMPWIPASQVGADMLPTPIKFVGETLPDPTMAPTVGEHTESVLRDVLGWDDARIAAAREAGAFGKGERLRHWPSAYASTSSRTRHRTEITPGCNSPRTMRDGMIDPARTLDAAPIARSRSLGALAVIVAVRRRRARGDQLDRPRRGSPPRRVIGPRHARPTSSRRPRAARAATPGSRRCSARSRCAALGAQLLAHRPRPRRPARTSADSRIRLRAPPPPPPRRSLSSTMPARRAGRRGGMHVELLDAPLERSLESSAPDRRRRRRAVAR